MRRADTIFVPDDARVVTYSELAAAYAEHGQLRTLADHYGVVASTVMRHLHAAGVSTKRVAVSEVAMLRARVAELEEKIAKGDDRAAAQEPPALCGNCHGKGVHRTPGGQYDCLLCDGTGKEPPAKGDDRDE